ncbi:NYN domain-containing protein [Anabaena sp. UHCC 0253]|uniref:NYN domain-containing protein n=1 Tax=Anabaena sp. UHCC 0253 TaxID=2590019 RepID=UPI0014457709|nr:NYN domain-containing protein [Anabaena sp. UHCC 0253]MTJ54350.1 NYN domain-containing protein [Anabaena sp. UHCC 0253]
MTHLPLNTQTVQKKDSVAIFCDVQNVGSITKNADLLLDFAKIQGSIKWKNFYYNSQHKNQIDAKNKFESLGFKCVDVPDNSKNSADKQLIFDCTQLFAPNRSSDPNITILVLGDWDFAGLICMLKKFTKVIIVAQKGSASPKLIKLVGDENFYFIDDLPKLVEKKTQPQITNIHAQISYNEAVECLKKAIKKAIFQGKPTNYSYLSTLMRQLFPKYQGVASISTPNGKKIKTFKQFVDMVVKEGKVIRQNQELFLKELDKIPA